MIAGRFIESQACPRDVLEAATGDAATLESSLGYPYYWYRATWQFRWPFHGRSLTVDCLVDARNGTAATVDALSLNDAVVADAACLESCIEPADAERSASRFLRALLTRRLRCPGLARLNVDSLGLVHRRLGVVRTRAGRFVVDPVSRRGFPLANAQRIRAKFVRHLDQI